MSKLVFLAIASGSMAVGAGLAAWQPKGPIGREARQAAIAVTKLPSLATATPHPVAASAPVAELDRDSDTGGLLLEAPTVEEFLEIASSASAEPLGDGERDRLEDLIRTDPELRRQFRQ